jgi:hypothetical protein
LNPKVYYTRYQKWILTLLKLIKLTLITDSMTMFKILWPNQFLKKKTIAKKILKKWICFFILEITRWLKQHLNTLFVRWQPNHSSNSYHEVTKQFWMKIWKMKKECSCSMSLGPYFSCMHNCMWLDLLAIDS